MNVGKIVASVGRLTKQEALTKDLDLACAEFKKEFSKFKINAIKNGQNPSTVKHSVRPKPTGLEIDSVLQEVTVNIKQKLGQKLDIHEQNILGEAKWKKCYRESLR